LVALLTLVAAAAVVGGVVVTRPQEPTTPASPSAVPTVRATLPRPPGTCVAPASSTSPADWQDVAAIALSDVEVGTSLTRRDPKATGGPWSVLVHRADGSLGQHGAVVTYPVERFGDGDPVDIRGARGRRSLGQVVWPAGGAHVRVRGDLGAEILTQIAKATTVVRGRPSVGRLYGFESTPAMPYRPSEVHEIRYDGPPLGAAGAALGFVYTGVLRGAALEDQLFAGRVIGAGTVHGQAAVASAELGGSGLLAWAPRPGIVAYVGYSGGSLGRAELQALSCLARSARPLTQAQWQGTHPQVSDQPNTFG
jgi:hypothetical protein